MPVTAIILTYNEELHIERCIKSLQPVCSRICIVDSFSTDKTTEIARSLGAEVFVNKWENNHSKQVNWGIENCNIDTRWTMRLDADEFLSEELQTEIVSKIDLVAENVKGIELVRRVYYKNKWIRFGGFYPIKLLRIWETGKGYSEQRLMDEHIVLKEGDVIRFENDFVDENLNSMFWWVTKHNNYARREAADTLNHKYGLSQATDISGSKAVKQAKIKRFLKNKIYNKLPIGVRPLMYFSLRFFIQLGFLDGPKGWIFHFMQGLWYRLLIDVLIWEAENETKGDKEMLKHLIEKKWGIVFE